MLLCYRFVIKPLPLLCVKHTHKAKGGGISFSKEFVSKARAYALFDHQANTNFEDLCFARVFPPFFDSMFQTKKRTKTDGQAFPTIFMRHSPENQSLPLGTFAPYKQHLATTVRDNYCQAFIRMAILFSIQYNINK